MTEPAESIETQVAGWLGDGWTVEQGRSSLDCATVVHTDGYRLQVSRAGGRLQISGQPPRTPLPFSWPYHVITCRPDRGPAIAAEIQRRLMPAYQPDFADAVARLAIYDEHERAQQAVTSRLSALAPTAGRRQGPEPEGEFFWSAGVDPTPSGRGDVRVSGDGTSVRIRIDYLTPDAAARVLSALTEEAPA